ncbi:MAG: hypothetical protein KJ950_09450 [Proteobacteria bacterium]|nr:hypothetical protein [Pseudomonadota bacterium]MBU1687619.1 hypothetical protein [Pseudomonadota bacterium]
MDDKDVIRVWYEGIGRRYHATRGPLAGAGCHDSPQHRMIYYGAVGVSLVIMGLGCVVLAYRFKEEFPELSMPLVLAGGITLAVAVLLFCDLIRLQRVTALGGNTDLADWKRRKVMQRAMRWGINKGLIGQDAEGRYIFTGKGD